MQGIRERVPHCNQIFYALLCGHHPDGVILKIIHFFPATAPGTLRSS